MFGLLAVYDVVNKGGDFQFAIMNKNDTTCMIEGVSYIDVLEKGDCFIHVQFKNRRIYSLLFVNPEDCQTAYEVFLL